MNTVSDNRDSSPLPEPVIEALRKLHLLCDNEVPQATRLTGGVSSDIWKVETGNRAFCVKRALAKLRVAADWQAPVERNRFEVAWNRIAGEIVPNSAPTIIAHDEETMLCVMEFLNPATHKLWKDELKDGRADPAAAMEAGRRLGCIHSCTAGKTSVMAQFPENGIFQAIRLAPYLEATALNHPDLKEQLFGLSRRTRDNRLVMIHGDVSPKNILLGQNGPVFLDAECACIGDPAFDLAFCINHFLLKCLWVPDACQAFFASFDAFVAGYLAEVDWESPGAVEARAASLLPGLFLARVDGKSPVEYLTDELDRDKVRRCARQLLASPPARLAEVSDTWKKELAR